MVNVDAVENVVTSSHGECRCCGEFRYNGECYNNYCYHDGNLLYSFVCSTKPTRYLSDLNNS